MNIHEPPGDQHLEMTHGTFTAVICATEQWGVGNVLQVENGTWCIPVWNIYISTLNPPCLSWTYFSGSKGLGLGYKKRLCLYFAWRLFTSLLGLFWLKSTFATLTASNEILLGFLFRIWTQKAYSTLLLFKCGVLFYHITSLINIAIYLIILWLS